MDPRGALPSAHTMRASICDRRSSDLRMNLTNEVDGEQQEMDPVRAERVAGGDHQLSWLRDWRLV